MPRLSTIIGQTATVDRLQTTLRRGFLSHAYLLAGPRGIGKTTTARALAKAINCESTGGLMVGHDDSCELCVSCRQADAGVHPDIHVISPRLRASEAEGGDRGTSTEIRIDQVRNLRRMVNLSPSVGRRNVFIVSPAEAMNEQAQNALLKSLEEPPPLSIIILCTESAGSILQTIQSRCQVFHMGLAPRSTIEHHLRELFALSTEEAPVVAALSQGRVGRAIQFVTDPGWRSGRASVLDLLEQCLKGDALRAVMSAGQLREAAQTVSVPLEARQGGSEDSVSSHVAPRVQLEWLLEEMAVLMRDLLVLRAGSAAEESLPTTSLVVNLDRVDRLSSIARHRTAGALLRGLEAVLTGQDLLRRNVSPQLLLEDLLLELAGSA